MIKPNKRSKYLCEQYQCVVSSIMHRGKKRQRVPDYVSDGEAQASSSENDRSYTPPRRNDEPQQLELAVTNDDLLALRRLVSTGSNNVVENSNVRPNVPYFKDDRLISDFDPNHSNVNDWLHKINDLAHMYRWDELTIVYLALGKLKGTARVWYDGLRSTRYTWKQWQEMLIKTFPSKINFGKLFYEAATYEAMPGQDLSVYSFTKQSKINKLGIDLSDEQIVDCVIEGIKDKQIQLAVRAANCKTFVELADYVRHFPSTSTVSTKIKVKPNINVQNYYKQNQSRRVQCFRCKEFGHKKTDCIKRVTETNINCSFCHKNGHTEQTCFTKQRKQLTSQKNIKLVGSIKDNKYCKRATINKHVILCLIDMGSECTLMRESSANKINLKMTKLRKKIELKGFNGGCVYPEYECEYDITIDGVTVKTLILVVKDTDLTVDLLIGHTFTENSNVVIVKKENNLLISYLRPDVCSDFNVSYRINSVDVVEYSELSDFNHGDINAEQKGLLFKLLNNYRDRFSFAISELGKTTATEMQIECLTDKPIIYRPYRLSFEERKQVKEMINELLENNIIRESHGPYASPILLVKKKDGGNRMCIDFRALNRITKKDKYPLPLIDDQIDRLGGYKYFITLDLASGYYQVPINKDSIEKTGFVTPDGHYEFLRMPFGLTNAPSVFQRLMNFVLGDLRYQTALVYIDDIIIPANSFEQGVERLTVVLDKLREHNLTLKLSKCFFFKTSIDYLGREISEAGVRPGAAKVSAIQNMPTPGNVKQVRQFIGLAGYFRKFIKNFAIITNPLTRLLKKDVPWEWTECQDKSVRLIQELLVSRPILKIFEPNLKTEIHTDASKLGLAGMLLQQKDNAKHVVSYFSRQTTPLEQKFHSYELETLAAVESCRYFRNYVIGIKFKLVTDCSAIRSTALKKDIVPRIGRWWLQLQDFDFEIEYRPGAKMAHVDFLSRNPQETKRSVNVLNVINITESEWLLAAQLQDEQITEIRNILASGENNASNKSYFDNYILKDDKVYRKLGNKAKWVVPKQNRWQICKLCHDDIGHFGLEKTLAKIQENYWFTNMRRYVQKYVAACLNCLYYKMPSGRRPGLLHPIDKITVPFHTLHIDHLGPFIKSKKGNTQLIVIVDGFTKFSIIEPVRNTKSKYVIKALNYLMDIFGVPIRLISDRGTAFTSHSFKTFCTENGIKHILNAVATPRANGQCERYNRTILASLAALNGDREDDNWDGHVKTVQRGLNSTVNKAIGTTPSEALFGTKLRNVSEAIILNEIQDELDYVDLRQLRETVKQKIDSDQLKQKERFNAKRCKPLAYNEGDLVMVRRTDFPSTGESRKLTPKYKGPFRIVHVLPNERYAVKNLTGQGRTRKGTTVVAVDKIKPWVILGEEVRHVFIFVRFQIQSEAHILIFVRFQI